MIFHSADFIIFMLVVLAVYWLLGRRLQNVFLLAASYFFYGYVHAWFLSLIIISTVIDYFCGLGIEKYPLHKKKILWISLLSNFGMLGFFKYFGFFVESVSALLEHAGFHGLTSTLKIILPVGISFYTFQTLSYTIDIYRGTLKARKDFLDYALYVAFFPQLVAGPIERAARLLPQLEAKRYFDPVLATHALHLMMWGFFKKMVIADNAGVICNKVYMLENPTFLMLWAGTFAFHVQIFADFSAYTDIARGTARLLGIDLVRNFNHPYIAVSISDFWSRWHMSLSSWVRDYIYIPLGGSRVGRFRRAFNTIFTFTLMGLWHGANWNYVLWGAYQGVFVYFSQICRRHLPASLKYSTPVLILRVIGTFFIIMVSWVIFREQDLHYMLKYLTISPAGLTRTDYMEASYLFMTVLIYFTPILIHILYSTTKDVVFAGRRKWLLLPFKALVSAALLLGILTMSCPTAVDFIYFRF